jgi:tetratricopeptide (TPR) repeat protein
MQERQHARAAIAADLYFDQFDVTDKRARWANHACVAAAYAELGRFDKAIEAQENALELVEYVPLEAHEIRVREIVELRVRAALELYRSGSPLRTYKTYLSKLSDDWANAVLEATEKDQLPKLAPICILASLTHLCPAVVPCSPSV